MLKELTMLNGVSGDEDRVRDFILSKIKDYVTELSVDTMGNIIAYKCGKKPTGKKVMVCAHIDEVGFIVSDITDDGFIKFKTVGGVDERILLTQRVIIHGRCGDVDGIIGIKAVHLQTADERKKIIPMDSMYIDIGAKDKADALTYVSKGDYICFNSPYRELGVDSVKAKAIDDRVGCAIILNLVKKQYNEDIYFCFNTQEEVGLRGATIVANKLGPDACFVLEATTASDTPYTDEHLKCTKLGQGPVLSIMDRASYSDKELNKFVCSVAKRHNIDYQFKKTINGGNDAGAISISGKGVKTCVISLPCRYIHSPVSMARKSDIDKMERLVDRILESIDEINFENRR